MPHPGIGSGCSVYIGFVDGSRNGDSFGCTVLPQEAGVLEANRSPDVSYDAVSFQ